MEHVMKKIIGLTVVVAAMALASPAIAQSFDPDNGTGNIPVAAAKRFETKTVPEYLGANAYASARRKDTQHGWGSTDVTTGGGSPGYNEMLRNW
jgi:hypothetical protein